MEYRFGCPPSSSHEDLNEINYFIVMKGGALVLVEAYVKLPQPLHLDHHQRDQSKVDGERAALDHFPIEKL